MTLELATPPEQVQYRNLREFGHAMAVKRQTENLTQRQVSEIVGTPQHNVSLAENGFQLNEQNLALFVRWLGANDATLQHLSKLKGRKYNSKAKPKRKKARRAVAKSNGVKSNGNGSKAITPEQQPILASLNSSETEKARAVIDAGIRDIKDGKIDSAVVLLELAKTLLD